jgi:hypothetical protein
VPDVGGLDRPFTSQPFRFAAFQQLVTPKDGRHRKSKKWMAPKKLNMGGTKERDLSPIAPIKLINVFSFGESKP